MKPHNLISKCNKGNRKAQFELYRYCYDFLMPVCLRYKGEDEMARELLNIAFMKILKGLKNFKNDGSFEGWCKRVTVRSIIDELRKEKAQKNQPNKYHTENEYELTNTYTSINNYEYDIVNEDLVMLIEKLPNTTKKVFNLYAIDGFDHQEIAEMLGIKYSNSKWHLSEARKRLRKHLKELQERRASRVFG